MNKYTATFSDGTTVTRKSERDYAVAWLTTWTDEGKECYDYGFSVSREKVSPYVPNPFGTFRGMSSKQRAAANAANAEFHKNANVKHEIVDTKKI